MYYKYIDVGGKCQKEYKILFDMHLSQYSSNDKKSIYFN